MVLTKKQLKMLQQRAYEVVLEDVEGNQDMLAHVVDRYVEQYANNPSELALLVSSDTSLWPELFDFDPRTGKPWPKED
jgi:hypothetical protein